MAEDKKNQTQDSELTMDDIQKISDSIAKNNKKTTLEFIDKASYTKTFVKCKITEALGNYNYKVWVNGAEYTIKCEDSDFSVSDLVTVIVPNNNWSNMYIDFKKSTEGDGWKPDKDWLKLPPALDGQITMLVNNSCPLSIAVVGVGSITIDWGDGLVETLDNTGATHIYTENGHLVSNGTKQYICTISNITTLQPNRMYSNNILMASVNVELTVEYTFDNSKTICQIDILKGTTLPIYFCSYCYSLKKVNLCNTLTNIQNAFQADYSIREISFGDCNITNNQLLLSYCYNLKTLDLSKSTMTSLPDNFANNCNALEKVILPPTIASIGKNAFYRCYSLSSINIPNGCTIGQDAFFWCDSLHPTPI